MRPQRLVRFHIESRQRPAYNFIMLHIATCFFVVLCIARGEVLQSPEDTEAAVMDVVTLKCRTDASAEWRFKKANEPTAPFEIIYKRGTILGKFRERFSVVLNATTGQCDLIIRDVRLDDAGRYTCVDRDAELIVFEKYPSNEFCKTTSAPNGNQNDCGLELLTLSCELNYRANQSFRPTLEWLEGNSPILTTVVKNNSDGSVTSSIPLQKGQLETAKFTCRVRYSGPLTTSRFTWSPSMNITSMEKANSMSYGGCDNQTIDCAKGKNPHCQYTWKDENGTEVSSSSSMEMAGKPNGNYTCLATCKVHQASCSHVAKLFIYRCDDSNSQSTSATSATSSQETFAPPGSLKNSQEITSPGMYIGLPVASVILIAVILLVALLLFRRSLFTCNGTARGNHTISEAESGLTRNSNHIDMTPLDGTISEVPTEKDVMLTDTHWSHSNDVSNISEMSERNRSLTETLDGVS